MGAYLSAPVKDKVSSDESGKNVAFGASSMQGWRISQEDAHNCCIEYDENASLFAVYDGHGGHEVATYCASKLPEFIRQTEAYKSGDIRQALIDAFLGFDATLKTPEIVQILKEISLNKSKNIKQTDDPEESDDDDNVVNLRKEAEMPLEQVMAKYQMDNSEVNATNFNEKPTIVSPYLRSRRVRDKAGSSSSGAGCSSSSLSWNTNETDVSSSSQQSCGSSFENKANNGPGSSETDLVLDSTTSNGETNHKEEELPKDGEPVKSADMPDSSADVTEKVSPSKTAIEDASIAQKPVDSNGSDNTTEVAEPADNDREATDNVSSSSNASVENGDSASQQEGISSSSIKKEIKKSIDALLRSSFRKTRKEGVEASDEDDNDIFDSLGDSDEDDDEDEEDILDDDDDDNESYDEEDDEDNEDDDDDEDEDDDEEMDSEFMANDEPGTESGCTAVVAILHGQELFVANAGDSRCVLCRDGEALELSLDHKPEDDPEMSRILKAGGNVTCDGRVNGGLNLSRALGDHAYKQNRDLPPEDQMISPMPDIRHVTIDPQKDEFMVLACDGIWNSMSSADVIRFVRSRIQVCDSLSKICEELFDHCLAPDSMGDMGDGTGCDNMTAVIVKFLPNLPKNSCHTNEEDSVSISRKRSVSPKNSVDGEHKITSDSPISECKRAKVETV